jgi:RNA polymerase primary sigma factor
MARSITKDPARVQLLTSAGNVGLLVAIDKFEAEKDTRFLTYAAWWIRKEMFDEIQSSGIVHVPSHKQKSARKAQKTGIYVCENCGLRLDPEVDPRGVKNKCIKGKQHEFILRECDEVLSPTISIDDTLTLSISADVNVEEQVIDTSVAALIRNALRCIPMRARDKYILLQYYDIPETSRRTASKGLFQLSEVAGITPERVRQIKEKLLREIRIELRRMSVNNMTDVIAVC